MTAIQVDMWADIVCPWCYIAKHRLEQAIGASERPAEVTVTYHAYELDPRTPVGEGTSVLEHLADKYHTDVEGARSMAERAAEAGRPDGLKIDVETQIRANSFDAHRLVALGLAQGGHALQAAALERFFSAHFAEGRPIDDRETLQRLAAEAGLDERRTAAVLASDDFAEQVRADEQAAEQLGVTGVPFVVANNRIAVSGAHSAETFGELLKKASQPD